MIMEIKVGVSYKTRIGRTTKIIGSFKGLDNKPYFKGDNKFTYDKYGKINPSESRPEDIISTSITSV